MSLVVIAQPWSESELSVMLCTLEAHRIPAFVQGAFFGSLKPGPQIGSYNARRIMVSSSFAVEARQVLKVFTRQDKPATFRRPSILNVIRAIFEFVLFGWFIPGNRRRAAAVPNPSSKRTREKPRAA